jgi:Arm DNA-binding domain
VPVLTTAAVRKFKSAHKGREIPDAQSPGLRLMVHKKFVGADGKPRDGAKAWIMRFRRPDGRPCKLTLGRVHILEPNEKEPEGEPVVGAPLTLRAARQLAAQISRERARGVDVIAANAVQKSRDRAKVEDATANSFGKLAVQFFRDHKVKKWGTRPRRWRGDAAILGLRWDCDDPAAKGAQVIPGGLAERWIDKPLASIDGHDVDLGMGKAVGALTSHLNPYDNTDRDLVVRGVRPPLAASFMKKTRRREPADHVGNGLVENKRPQPGTG